MRTGIVLAGGRSARFGADKLAEPLGGDPLLERAIAAVADVVDEVIVAGRAVTGRAAGGHAVTGRAVTDRDSARQGIRGIPDAEPFAGPLLALVGLLEQVRAGTSIVVGGDMPELVPDVLRAMLDRLETDSSLEAVILARPDAALGGSDLPPQVLPMAILVAPALGAARAAVSDGRRSLRALLERLVWIELPADAWLPIDPDAATLLDVDTRADFDRLRAGKGR